MSFQPIWLPHDAVRQQTCEIESHPAFERMLAKLPAEMRASFTSAQLALLAEASRPPPLRHWVDYRVSLPFFGARFYLTIFCGKERRLLSRVRSEGQASLAKTSVFYILALWILISIALVAGLALLYTVKSALGINVFEGPSFLHDYLFIRLYGIDVVHRLPGFS